MTVAAVCTLLCVAGSGCSLFVMGGKMLFGDPKQESPFRKVTGVDLTEGEHTVLVLASSPEGIKQRFPEVDQELMRRIGRELRSEGVEVVRSDEVLDWIEERGGTWHDVGPIAGEFEADYVLTVELSEIDWFEPHSPDLLRGRSAGVIRAYRSTDRGYAESVFGGEFQCVYPTLNPKPTSHVSEKIFREQFLDRLCLQAAQRFYDHTVADTVL